MNRCLFIFFSFATLFADPTICLNMIVKNESHVIKRCLESVKPLIDYWVIVDTGSDDDTIAVIKEFMKDIPGEIHERAWVNFAHNRNEALHLAKEKADYLLFIDADDILTYDPDFKKPKLDKPGYNLTIKYANTTYTRPQLIKSSYNWQWAGVIHEALVSTPHYQGEPLEGVTMVIMGGGDRSRDPQRTLKDIAVLEKALEEEPNQARYTFYLANGYREAGQIDNAIKTYQKRIDLGGWAEEVYLSHYHIARLSEQQGQPQSAIVQNYYRAFKYRPTRAEPLYWLSQYYRFQENYLLAYLVAKHGLEIAHPTESLFVDSWIYDYGMLLEYSISAYWIEKYEESYQACMELLTIEDLPQHVRDCVNQNLKFALQKLHP